MSWIYSSLETFSSTSHFLFPGIALYDPVFCFFVLFCSCFSNTFTWRLCQIEPFITYFEEGKAERRRHRKKAHLTATLAAVQQDQCLVFSPHSFKWYIWSWTCCHRIDVCLCVSHTNLDDGTQVYWAGASSLFKILTGNILNSVRVLRLDMFHKFLENQLMNELVESTMKQATFKTTEEDLRVNYEFVAHTLGRTEK